MSYIIPVTDYQTVQYAARTAGELENTNGYIKGTTPVFRVELARKQKAEKDESIHNYNDKPDSDKAAFSISQRKKHFVPMEILQKAAEITGKGQFFQTYI
ncbi:hypothetical protein V1498_16210 [Peribacillus sp. SCS-26]|uniref:hypothetical protein n=1 Tax=Paraperibacillus marinus TaxID=3115295 RepID=UPI0039057918